MASTESIPATGSSAQSRTAFDNLAISAKHATAHELSAKYARQIQNTTILITGATPKGLGAGFALAVAESSPSMIILTGRSISTLSRSAAAIKAINPQILVPTIELDLSSLAFVRAAAMEISQWVSKIDALVLNAGIMAVPFGATIDGHERHFGTNHLGHFYLTNLLMPKLLAAEHGARIVSVTSDLHHASPVRFDDLMFGNGKQYDKWAAYAQSKTANALFALELAKRLNRRGVLAFAVHPGLIATGDANSGTSGTAATGIGRHMSKEDLEAMGIAIDENGKFTVTRPEAFKSLSEGAAGHVFAAFDPEIADNSGDYVADARLANDQAAAHARDAEDSKRLWELSEQCVGQQFEY